MDSIIHELRKLIINHRLNVKSKIHVSKGTPKHL